VTAGSAALIRMRALGDPDVRPAGGPDAEEWRPWRSYATRYLRTPLRGTPPQGPPQDPSCGSGADGS
ncbi:DNA-3-methyladenine glycosylase 2 family protein, partial [Streptomyces sp. SR27]|nr:DNA-3-methyladenine glycosylase 2 family protein [Streptomyces sp. SR27]